MMRLYAIKNDNGKWSDEGGLFYPANKNGVGFIFTMFSDRDEATRWAEINTKGGHIVTLIEEPEKVVLTKEQAEIVENAHIVIWPAAYISGLEDSSEQRLLMNAYVNGYTVEKEKKYLVELDGLVTTDGAKQYLTKKEGKWFACRRKSGLHQDFTDKELNVAPEWAKQLNREEVTDDDD